eukprot:jgi/Phyca11/17710/fgenesh1_pg.PHYCAscaffold_30_\
MLASAKSMDDEAARLAVLRDPKRMAALLVRAFSSSMLEETRNGSEEDEMVEETQEEFQELERRASAGTAAEATPLRVVIHPASEEDEDDAEEEEEVDEQEEEAGKPLDEEELEAAATALQTATRIVEELRLKMMLKAGEQMERQKHDTDNEPPFSTTGSLITTPPRPENSPSATGGGPAVRTCDPCARWFQKAMDRYFDAMELTKEQDQESTVHRGSMGEVMIEEKSRSLSNFANNITHEEAG